MTAPAHPGGRDRRLFTTLAKEAGVADPDFLARQLRLLYDGAGLSARMDHDPSAATTARAAWSAAASCLLRGFVRR